MAEQIDVQAVIDQLMTRIAQLELEVAVLKAMGSRIGPSTPPGLEKLQEPDNGGYM